MDEMTDVSDNESEPVPFPAELVEVVAFPNL